MAQAKSLLFILLPFFTAALILIFVCIPINSVDMEAVDGVLDLRGVELSDTSFRLSGEWLVSFNDETPTPVSFPRRQEDLFSERGYGVGDKQTCTLTILTDEDMELEIYLSEIEDSVELKVNGDVLYSTDRISGTVVKFMPQDGVSVIELTSVCHIAGNNGLRKYLPSISASPFLSIRYSGRHIISAFILGGFFLIGIYHLILFIFSSKDKIYLAFAASCVFSVGWILLETDGLVPWYIPPTTDIHFTRP